MEEESIEHDLEERMYAALHYVDETQPENTNENEIIPNFDKAQQSTIRRYWRTNENFTTYNKVNTSSHKINTPSDKTNTSNKKETDKCKSKSNENPALKPSAELSLFQQPLPHNVKKTIEILETEDKNTVVELESSDEDEVVEVALPPKPTITIESSDEEDIHIPSESKKEKEAVDVKPNNDQDRTSSPVPSSVSSISDEFIRSDCIALNILSRHPDQSTLDYSLHGSDLEQTPSKKRKKRKSKDATSTPISSKSTEIEECFATPKSKAKNKKQKTKSYQVSNISIPSADVYDSDSNQSIVESNKSANYKVTDKSLPNTDVYETDSNQSENIKDSPIKSTEIMVTDVDSLEHLSKGENQVSATSNKVHELERRRSFIDLTGMDSIEESIVMANVTGFSNQEDDINIDENLITKQICPSKCGSTKIPAILYEDLDFDNLKGNKVCKKRRYSLTALRAEMDKFYNESWGGEDFNHREIQKNMSRDKSLWAIDPKDRMPALAKRKTMCNVCNRVGHRDDACRLKTPICYMCGSTGHYEPRCPKKICVNCGSPNHIYTTMCRNCSTWNSIRCAECGQNGHPSSHCPDVWRRYHNTLNLDATLEENRQVKKHYQMFCSGCTRRGHLVHSCRLSLPFSGLPIYSPYVMLYRPVYCQTTNDTPQNNEPNNRRNKQQKKNNQDASTPKTPNKRQSKSPIANDFMNKKRNIELSDDSKNSLNNQQKKHTPSKENKGDSNLETSKNTQKSLDKKDTHIEDTPDFIAVSSSNHDEKGQIIQDNEVSDTSEVITSARIYITNEICESLKTTDGVEWLKQVSTKNNITVENTDNNFYISIKGSVGNQEAFQSELRDWIKSKQPAKEQRISESDANSTIDSNDQSLLNDSNIPKNRNNLLRKLNKALDSLKADIGDPKALYKELTYLQNRQQQLMTQHVVSPKQLSNNRGNIKMMLRKLNMVLLGQAGLADGSTHLKELYSLQEKLTNFRNKNISKSLRQEIGEHFHCIFTAIPRDDYVELLSKYYNKSPKQGVGKNRKRKQLKMSPNMIQNNKVSRRFSPKHITDSERQEDSQLPPFILSRFKKARSRLIFFHSRLMNAKPVDSLLKKARGQIIKELHCNIASFSNVAKLSTKDLKKAKKVQEQAKQLLTNLEMISHN